MKFIKSIFYVHACFVECLETHNIYQKIKIKTNIRFSELALGTGRWINRFI